MFRTPPVEETGRAEEPWKQGDTGTLTTDPLDEYVRGAIGRGWDASASDTAADPIICHCSQVTQSMIEDCIRRGCSTRQEIANATGAGTVCGGCTPQLVQLLGGKVAGYETQITEIGEILPTVRSFRFTPPEVGGSPVPGAPGQHVLVSALIDGEWISRPYTLTSPAGQARFQEITVKLEPDGRLSNWLFGLDPLEQHSIRVTSPQGTFQADLTRSEPIVFFAAGIGITPAISIARTLAAQGGSWVHIDYSARESSGLAFREEIEFLSAACDRITTHFRVTSKGHRLTERDIAEYKWRFPRGRYLLCGPDRFQTAIRRHLRAVGVDDSRIRCEVFTPPHIVLPESRAEAPARITTDVCRTIGLFLLMLYLVQGFAGWEWSWLQSIQEGESYRRWSGALLLAFIATQWMLPAARLGENIPAAALAYRAHRWLGAFAPAFFYAHAVWPGVGYLLALGWVYLANVGIGLGDKTLFTNPAIRQKYGRVWLVPHVALACLTVGLSLFHIFVVFAYK